MFYVDFEKDKTQTKEQKILTVIYDEIVSPGYFFMASH